MNWKFAVRENTASVVLACVSWLRREGTEMRAVADILRGGGEGRVVGQLLEWKHTHQDP